MSTVMPFPTPTSKWLFWLISYLFALNSSLHICYIKRFELVGLLLLVEILLIWHWLQITLAHLNAVWMEQNIKHVWIIQHHNNSIVANYRVIVLFEGSTGTMFSGLSVGL